MATSNSFRPWLRFTMLVKVWNEWQCACQKFWCHTCRKYGFFIMEMKNFSSAWIKGSTNQKTSNVVDHATSEQHTIAMTWMQVDNAKASKVPHAHYAPIAKCFSKMDTATYTGWRNFDVCYLLAKENMAFLKYLAYIRTGRMSWSWN